MPQVADNNDGISIIDVTDPYNPLYCFVHGGTEDGDEEEARKPLTAEGYVRKYYAKYTPRPEPEVEETEQEKTNRLIEKDVLATVALLKDYKIVSLQMLAEAWPSEYEKAFRKYEKDGVAADASASALPSLLDMSILPAITHALKSNDTTNIEALVWMPGKVDTLKPALSMRKPFPDGGMTLLKKIIAAEVEKGGAIDLSGFELSTKQIIDLVPDLGKAESLDLSHNPILTIDAVRAILSTIPIRRLVLLDCPFISSSDISTLLKTEPRLFYHLEALIHPFFFSVLRDTLNTSPYPNAFSYIGIHQGLRNPLTAASLPYFTLETVLCGIAAFLAPFESPDYFIVYQLLGSSLPVQAALASLLKPGQKWSERSTWVIPQLGLGALIGQGWTFATDLTGRFRNRSKADSYAFLKLSYPKERAAAGESEDSGDSVGVGEKVDARKSAPVGDGVQRGEAEGDSESKVKTEVSWEIYDLPSFVERMMLEGRPAPSEAAITNLHAILVGTEAKIMEDADVREWLRQIPFGLQAMY